MVSDDTDASAFAFEQAARLAERIPASEIHLVYVTSADTPAEQTERLAGQFRAYVDEKVASLGGLDGRSAGVHIRGGKPVPAIVQLAAEIEADLLVVASPKHPHLGAFLPGSVQEGLAQHAPCPILVAGPRPAELRAHSPAIEAACPDCLKARAATHGAEWWCERHRGVLPAHTYSYQADIPFASRDTAVDPTGGFGS
ncbi:MAG TPA: universal stress protein [Polyangiaceae bacterium]|nr:universal stress protein [Polyangiaceae bacterium]